MQTVKQQPLDMVMAMVKKSKLHAANVVGFFLAFVLMFFPWFKFEYKSAYYNASESASYFKYSDFSDMVVMAIVLAAIAGSAFVLYSLYSKSLSNKTVLAVTTLSAIGAVVAILISTLSVLSNNEDFISVGIGYYLFTLVCLVLAGANGFRAFQNKDDVMTMANAVKSQVEKKAGEMQSSASSAEKK